MYDTLRQLQEAYQRGELSEEEPLWLDNDSTDAFAPNPGPDPSKCLFSMHPADVLEQALDLLGIPHEHV
jgi:hypothetical protein